MKRTAAMLFILILLFSWSGVCAERRIVEKDEYYLGAMRVIRCREFVSLREAPYKTAKRLAKVPLDAIVYYCTRNEKTFAYSPYKKQVHQYVKCEYEGQEGYIMTMYLEKAPEYEPVESKAESILMTREEVIGSGEIVFEWKEFNVTVLAAYETSIENEENWENIRVGCFIDDEPTWGYKESVQQTGQFHNLKAFMGGTEDEPQVYVYDAEYGLTMLDLMDGTEQWVLSKDVCPLGDAAAVKAGANTGILYVAGTDGPDPVAISAEGNVLWRSEIDDPEIYGPTEIVLNPNDIEVHYEDGKIVKLEYNGEVISITDA